jgi:MtN3 and saliva related transmembrane protein
MDLTMVTGIAASLFTSVALLPQLIKIIREKDSEGVSLTMLLVLFTGLVLWTVYGVLRNDVIIIAANSFSLLVNILTALMTIRHRKGD